MRSSFIALSTALCLIASSAVFVQARTPHTPNTGQVSGMLSATTASTSGVAVATSTPAPEPTPTSARTRAEMTPVSLLIPAIKLDASVEEMGVLKNGELNVPSGKTNNVGWYAAGTLPGERGSTVMDAHVFAAFKNLSKLHVGDDIYVVDADGTKLHFKVETTEVFKLKDLSARYLFSRADKKRLTLITCAGQLTADHSTYTHRLVVSAVLVE